MSYDMIDRFLRSNLDDDDYAEYSLALDQVASPPAQQEPVAWVKQTDKKLRIALNMQNMDGWRPLVFGDTSPPEQRQARSADTWVGLTEQDLDELACGGLFTDRQKLARGVEAKLKEKNNGFANLK